MNRIEELKESTTPRGDIQGYTPGLRGTVCFNNPRRARVDLLQENGFESNRYLVIGWKGVSITSKVSIAGVRAWSRELLVG